MMKQVMLGIDRAVGALQALGRTNQQGQLPGFPGEQFGPGAEIFTWDAEKEGYTSLPPTPG